MYDATMKAKKLLLQKKADNDFMKAYAEACAMMNDPEVRLQNYRDYIWAEVHREGLEKGIEKGIKQGIEQGIEKGIEQGKEEGREVAIQEIVRAMRKKGLSDEQMAEIIDRPIHEIRKIT